MKSAPRIAAWTFMPLGWLGVVCFGAALLLRPPGFAPVAGVRNADLHELPGADAEPLSVVLLSDIQNGAGYLPELLRRAEAFHPRAILITGDLAADPPIAQIPVWYLRRHPPSVPMFIVTHSRISQSLPTTSRVGPPRYLTDCGGVPSDANG